MKTRAQYLIDLKLNSSKSYSHKELKKQYKILSATHHVDKTGDLYSHRTIIEAYETLLTLPERVHTSSRSVNKKVRRRAAAPGRDFSTLLMGASLLLILQQQEERRLKKRFMFHVGLFLFSISGLGLLVWLS